jgi:hypothetical protein
MKTNAPQVYSLTHPELDWLDAQTDTLPGDWSLEVVRDPAEFSAVLLPAGGDRFAASYLIDRQGEGYRLMACRWDVLELAGVFPTLADAVTAVAEAARAAARAGPFTKLQ